MLEGGKILLVQTPHNKEETIHQGPTPELSGTEDVGQDCPGFSGPVQAGAAHTAFAEPGR